MVELNTILKGRYEIRREIKRGGMGAVFEAYDRLKDDLIAVKQTFNSTGIHADLFFREAALLARLNHPSLPKVHDFFTEGNNHFLTMDFIAGEDLYELLMGVRGGKPFAVEQVLNWADELLDALDYLHTHKPRVVHRDIKSGNIRLTPELKVMLLDFGLAKNLATELEKNSLSLSGTPGFRPPEQWLADDKVDGRADLYAFGATLYHLLTATVPPDSVERLNQLHKRKVDPLRPANELNPQVSASLATIIAKAMSLDRDERFASAKEMREALRDERRKVEQQRQTQEQQRAQAEQQQREQAANWQADYERLQRENAELQRRLAAQQQQSERPPEAEATHPRPQPPPAAPPAKPFVVQFDETGQPLAAATKPSRRLILAGGALTLLIAMAGLIALNNRNAGIDAPGSFTFETVTLDASGKEIERKKKSARYFTEDLGNGVTLEMVAIPGGTFTMGSPASENQRNDNEGPQHQVTVPAFAMGKYEVTQQQWQALMNNNPSSFKGDLLPVEIVSWNDAKEFCAKLSSKTGKMYRLPSEAEWEYAARAGTTTPFAFGETITPQLVNYNGNYPYASAPKGEYRQKTVPVGSLGVANTFGLFDLHGNVWEWCEDVWHSDYTGAPTDGSAWTSGGEQSPRVLRGGSWFNDGWLCRAAGRSDLGSGVRLDSNGFRVVVSARTQ